MCIFTQPAEVSSTCIFARLLGDSRQGLVYKMHVRSETDNAMVLPLPVRLPSGEDSVKFHSLKHYPNLFRDIEKGFRYGLYDVALDLKDARSGSVGRLKVHEVGSFIASYIPTLSDFPRLDPVFRLPASTWDKLPVYSDYGFAVFQLKADNLVRHPLAFEFESRFPEKIFFPTVHIHDNQVHAVEHFDHKLYLQHSKLDRICGRYSADSFNIYKDPHTGLVRSNKTAGWLCRARETCGLVSGNLLVHRHTMAGFFANEDVIVDLDKFDFSIPNQIRGLSTKYVNPLSLSGMGLLLGASWIFRRRSKLQRDNGEAQKSS